MAYSQVADQRIQSPFKDAVNITDAYITQKISEADSIITGMIAGPYRLPLGYVPAIIVDISKALTTLLLLREQNGNIEVQPGQRVEDAWKTYMDSLTAISERKIKLYDAAGLELTLNEAALISGYPNAGSSIPTAPNNTAPKFTMNQVF